MSVQAIQLRVLHRVDWTSLMFNRHYDWLVVVVPTLDDGLRVAVLAVAGALVGRSGESAGVPQSTGFWWTWDLAGTTLGTLLLLGPLQAIQGFHPAAPLALAIGARRSIEARSGSPIGGLATHFSLSGVSRRLLASTLFAVGSGTT